MKINAISNNYKTGLSSRKKAVVFKSYHGDRYVQKAAVKLSELYDTNNIPVKDKLAKMLRFARTGRRKNVNLSDNMFDSVLNFLNNAKSQDADVLLKEYTIIGKQNFWNANKKLFESFINNPDAMNYKGYPNFRAERDYLGELNLIPNRIAALKFASPKLREFKKAGAYNGALDIIENHYEFLSGMFDNEIKTSESVKNSEVKNLKPPVILKEKKEIKTPKDFVKKISPEDAKILAEYQEIVKTQGEFPSGGTEAEKAAWQKMDEHRRELLNKLCDNDVSIVNKREFSLNPNEQKQEKLIYLQQIRSKSCFNKASQLDVIEEYEKYLTREWISEERGRSSIQDFSLACWPISDAQNLTPEYEYHIAERYVTVMEKLAKRDNAGMRDAVRVMGVMYRYQDIMDEKLALRYIELLKRISFQQADAMNAGFYTEKAHTPKVKQALKELEEALKEFPFKDRTKND